jgi:hypothetical protein
MLIATVPQSSFAKKVSTSKPTSKLMVYSYSIGEKSYIDSLFPTLPSSTDASCQPGSSSITTEQSIQCYLTESLKNDKIIASAVKVFLVNSGGQQFYHVSFQSADPVAAKYSTVQPQWLSQTYAGQALKGFQACQSDPVNCWKPQASTSKTCPAPWEFYLPLGLPMVSQNMVMLLHYPPYVSMQQYDYLQNNTLDRWERLFADVNGTIPANVSLYENILDINPIAAPGSGESSCLTTTMAENYFDNADKGLYISPMLNFLSDPPTNPSATNTRPVIAFGSEARTFLQQKYNLPSVNVMQAGTLKLSGDATKGTPYLGANHPIAAVYQTCTSNPGIVAMEQQDLATSCFATTMANSPNADPVATTANCLSSFTTNPSITNQTLICINAHIDMGGLNHDTGKPAVSWSEAQTWCNDHNQNPCPTTAKN